MPSSTVRSNVAQKGAAKPSGKFYAPVGPSLGLKGSILFMKLVDLFIFGEQRSCDGGCAAPVGRGNEPKNTGARSERVRTRGQNLLAYLYLN